MARINSALHAVLREAVLGVPGDFVCDPVTTGVEAALVLDAPTGSPPLREAALDLVARLDAVLPAYAGPIARGIAIGVGLALVFDARRAPTPSA